MTDDTILSHAEALTEIKRLREHIVFLEAAFAVKHGTWVDPPAHPSPTPDDDQPATITHDVPPNAPR